MMIVTVLKPVLNNHSFVLKTVDLLKTNATKFSVSNNAITELTELDIANKNVHLNQSHQNLKNVLKNVMLMEFAQM